MKLGKSRHPWGTELSGFGRPFGLGFDAAGRLHVTDMDTHLLVRFDVTLREFELHDGASGWAGPFQLSAAAAAPAPARNPAGWNGPHSVAFDADGNLYVTCYHGAAIHVLSPGGRPLRKLGEGLLSGPATALFDRAGRLLVAEYRRNAVLALDRSGALLGVLGSDYDRPHMVRELADGTLVVADTWNNRIQRLTARGDLIGVVGREPIACPVALDPEPSGRLLVVAWASDSVISFGATDGSCPRRLQEPPLKRPYDARSWGGEHLVADSHHSRVLIITAQFGDRPRGQP